MVAQLFVFVPVRRQRPLGRTLVWYGSRVFGLATVFFNVSMSVLLPDPYRDLYSSAHIGFVPGN